MSEKGGEQPLGADLGPAAAAIDADASRLEQGGAAPPGAPGAPAVVVVDWKAEAHDLVDFARGLFFPLYPRLAGVWTAEALLSLETRLAPVLKKYDLNAERILGKWGPEIMLAAVIAPAVLPTVKAIKADLADLRAEEKALAHPVQPAAPAAAAAAPSAGPTDTHQLHQEGNPAFAPAAPDQLKLHQKV